MALYLNLMDNVTKPIVASAHVSSLAKHGNRTQSGLVGASYLLQALQAAALHELALIIASAVDEPSLGYTVRGSQMRGTTPTTQRTGAQTCRRRCDLARLQSRF